MLEEIYPQTEQKMKKALEVFEEHLRGLRTGRANPALLQPVKVDYYGSVMPLSQLASISAPDARTLVVQPWDSKAAGIIEKAILEANLGLNPATRGDSIYVAIPVLTQDRRKDLARTARQYAEEARVAVRGVRREALEDIRELQHEKLISEDDSRRGQERLQTLTDRYVQKADELLAQKEQEILGE